MRKMPKVVDDDIIKETYNQYIQSFKNLDKLLMFFVDKDKNVIGFADWFKIGNFILDIGFDRVATYLYTKEDFIKLGKGSIPNLKLLKKLREF